MQNKLIKTLWIIIGLCALIILGFTFVIHWIFGVLVTFLVSLGLVGILEEMKKQGKKW